MRERQVQGWHAGRAHLDRILQDARRDQRHARVLALGQELAALGDQHPLAVMHAAGNQARDEELRLGHGNAGAGLDRVDEQFGNGGHAAGRCQKTKADSMAAFAEAVLAAGRPGFFPRVRARVYA